MDDRKLRAKALKKAYRKERRRKTLLWDLFSWILGLGAVACLCAGLYVSVTCVNQLAAPLWRQVKQAVGLNPVGLQPLAKVWAFPAAGGLLALWILCRSLSLKGTARAKKSETYLSLQTLRRTMKAEKEEASL